MQVSGTTSTSGNVGMQGQTEKPSAQQDFLQLLLVQMGNQDPSSPMDAKDMVAQLATLAQVEGQQQTVAQLDALLLAQTTQNQLAAADLVGKNVMFEGNKLTVDKDTRMPMELNASVGEGADKVTVVIKDEDGNVVRTLEQSGPFEPGVNAFTWDGRNDKGEAVKEGRYTMTVSAADKDGKNVDATELQRALVDAVSYASGYPMLRADGTELPLSDVYEVGV